MESKKSEYFRLFSEVINIQLSKGHDKTLVDVLKKEYLELSEEKSQGNFNLNGKNFLLIIVTLITIVQGS